MNGTKQIAQRMTNAESDFVQMIQERGFSKTDAEKVLRVFLKLKAAKVDAIIGRVQVKHGAFLEIDALRNAVAFKL